MASELREWRQQIFFDTAKFVNNEALSSLLDFTDDTHIMFSSDFPWASASKMRYWTSRLNENFMNNVTLERIYFKNAKNLFSKEDGLEPLNKIDLVEKRKPVHMHAMPVTLKDEIESLAIDISKVNWFDFEQLENKFLKEDYPLRITLDLPELWDKEQSLIDKFISQYNREIGILSEKHKNIFQAFGAIDLASSGCISQIESCILNSNIEGLCLFPPDDYDIKNLKPQVINLLSSLVIPVMIHPRDSRGTIIFNENKLAVPKFMAQIMYSGEIDKLTNLSFILTHTSGIHRDLIDSMGMLFYLRKDGWKMVRFIFDYFFRRKLKGEAILNDAIWD